MEVIEKLGNQQYRVTHISPPSDLDFNTQG